MVGQARTFAITTRGFPPVNSITVSGTLPTGVMLVDNHDGTASLVGTPAGHRACHGLFGDPHAHNGVTTVNQTFKLAVDQAPAFTSAATANSATGVAGGFLVKTTGSIPSPLTLARSGALPTGVTFTDNKNGTATLAGTPAAGTGGSYTLTFTATNSAG